MENDYLETNECRLSLAKEGFWNPASTGFYVRKSSPLREIFTKKSVADELLQPAVVWNDLIKFYQFQSVANEAGRTRPLLATESIAEFGWKCLQEIKIQGRAGEIVTWSSFMRFLHLSRWFHTGYSGVYRRSSQPSSKNSLYSMKCIMEILQIN